MPAGYVEAVIITLPNHLHRPAALVAARRSDLEKRIVVIGEAPFQEPFREPLPRKIRRGQK